MKSRGAAYGLLTLSAAVYFLPFLRVLSHNGDEGTLITGAARVAAGEVPFRDFFEVMGPGTFYWLAVFFRILGPTWFATRVSLLLTTVGIAVALFYLTRRLRPGLEAIPVIFFAAVSFHSWNAISHHLDSNLFGLLSVAAICAWIDRRRVLYLDLAGLGAGITTGFMLPKGGLLFASFTIVLFILYRRDPALHRWMIRLFSGYTVAVVAMAAFFALRGGLSEMVYANLIWPLANYSDTNQVPYGMEFRQLYWESFMAAFHPLFPRNVAAAVSGFLSIPFMVVMGLPLLLALIAAWKRLSLEPVTVPYWICGTAFWLSEIHRKDIAHLVFGSPLWIVLGFYYVRRVRSRWVQQTLQLVAISAVVLCLLNPAVALVAPYQTVTRRGTVYNAFRETPVLEFLQARIQPGEPVFIYPYSPLYYFLSAAQNPTRHSILMYQINTEAQFRDTVHSLETRRVRYVVWDRSFPLWIHKWFPNYRIPPEDQLIVEPYLTERYRVVGGQPDGYQFLERKDSTEASLVQPALRQTKRE